MELDQVGIALSCHCGANMSASMAGVLFGDKGRIKISGRPIRCSSCGAIYRPGERLKYSLLLNNGASGKNLKIFNPGTGFHHSPKRSKNSLDNHKHFGKFNGKRT